MKKNFKKMVALATATVLTLSMSFSAFATDAVERQAHDGASTDITTFDSREAEYDPGSAYKFDKTQDATNVNPSKDTVNVKVTVNDDTCAKVYNVTVKWDELSFTYTFDSEDVWDPETHTYTNSTTNGSWSGDKRVTITNHSNDDLTTAISVANESKTYGVTIAAAIDSSITGNDADLDDASVVAYDSIDNADEAIYKISPSGIPTKSDLTSELIAKVTVSISIK